MKRLTVLLSLLLLAGCGDTAGSTTTPPRTAASSSTTTSDLPASTTTTSTVLSPPELILDRALSSPIAPWHSVAVESPEVVVSGYVDPSAEVALIVTSPGVDGEIVFEGIAEKEDNYFHGTVTLVPGLNLVAVIATTPGGGRTAVSLDARYEPDATVEFGYLEHVSETEIVVDYAQWLTGEDAAQAAFEDGVIATVEERVPNDYYIRNANPELRTLPPASDVVVWLISPAAEIGALRVDPGEWLDLFDNGAPWDWDGDAVPDWGAHLHNGYYGASMVHTPYWFVILDGEVIAVEQQYVP